MLAQRRLDLRKTPSSRAAAIRTPRAGRPLPALRDPGAARSSRRRRSDRSRRRSTRSSASPSTRPRRRSCSTRNRSRPRSAREILHGALFAFVFSMFLIVVYLTFRFEFNYALPMIVALFHDLIITVGVYSLTGREVSSATVAAVLTVLGYSLYDTIIIFDRVRENEAAPAQAHVRRDRQHLAVGDADALAEHVADHAAPDPDAVPVRRRDAQGLRVRAADRHRLRRLLVVLHRGAAAGVCKGRRARVPAPRRDRHREGHARLGGAGDGGRHRRRGRGPEHGSRPEEGRGREAACPCRRSSAPRSRPHAKPRGAGARSAAASQGRGHGRRT